MTERGEVVVGTSGWRYEHWWGTFFPEDLAKQDSLAYYSERLPAVEVNRTFYSLPSIEAVSRWREAVPSGFRFAVKASRYITHMKKLKDPKEPLARLYEVVDALEDAAGPVLFQLPPRWRCDPERLASFLDALPDNHRTAFEFRDPSWFDGRINRLLADAGVAFCIWDLAGEQSPREVTADLVYLRLHGSGSESYTGRYDRQTLAGWAGACHAWAESGRDVWCFFDNDQSGYAPKNAMELREMVTG
jgi:uncharacterized protein YecE (DUF72 family)